MVQDRFGPRIDEVPSQPSPCWRSCRNADSESAIDLTKRVPDGGASYVAVDEPLLGQLLAAIDAILSG